MTITTLHYTCIPAIIVVRGTEEDGSYDVPREFTIGGPPSIPLIIRVRATVHLAVELRVDHGTG